MNQEKRLVYLVILFGVLSFALVSAAPLIDYVDPTPANNAYTGSDNFTEINVSIEEANLNEVIYNWDGTNFTYYNNSLIVMHNFENVSDLGENSTYVVDLSLRGEDTSCTNCPTLNTSRKHGNAYTYDGENDVFIDSNANLNFAAGQAHSIEMWARPFSANGDQFLGIGWDNGVSNKYTEHLWIDANAKIVWGFRRTWSGNWIFTTSDASVNLNEWSHLVAVNNGTDIMIYINAQLESSDGLGAFSGYPLDDNNLEIGGYSPWESSFNGSIDEFKLWNRSLSANEIYQEYVSSLNKFNSTQWYFYVNQRNCCISKNSNGWRCRSCNLCLYNKS